MELGAGATLAKLITEGHEIHSLVFSLRRKTVAEDFPKEELIRETQRAAQALGIARERLHIHDYPNREFPRLRQELLDALVRVRKTLEPDLVLTASFDDMHQDHHTIAEETFRAFKHTSVLSYELPWNRIRSVVNYYSVVSSAQLQRKIRSLACYRSQVPSRERFFSSDYTRSLALVRGAQVSQRLAEAFEVVRWIA